MQECGVLQFSAKVAITLPNWLRIQEHAYVAKWSDKEQVQQVQEFCV